MTSGNFHAGRKKRKGGGEVLIYSTIATRGEKETSVKADERRPAEDSRGGGGGKGKFYRNALVEQGSRGGK